ncbi:MAG: preprotein translocase subunit SecE [Patescibacteria group bacterium]
MTTFLQEVRTELAKVSWPNRSQVIRYTGVVVAITVVMAAYLGVLDALFAYILTLIVS